ncbi:MAG TPA: hypothetical protein VMV18_02845 [bacterium]|nr:hypothetical protein [bacterium]
MHPRKHTKLGQLLVQQGMVQEWQFLQAMGARRPGQKLGEVMVERKFLSEEQLGQALALQLDLRFVRLALEADPKCVKMMPGHIARRFLVFPVELRETKDDFNVPTLVVAMADPTDERVIDALRFLLNVDVEPVLATKKDLEKAIRRTYGDDDPSSSDALPIPFPYSRNGRSSGAMSMNYAA